MSILSKFAFLLWILFLFSHAAAAQHTPAKRALVTLRELVPSNDKLAELDLCFDTSFARQAIEYLRSNDPRLLGRMADPPAITHILNHARNFNNNDVPKESRTTPQTAPDALYTLGKQVGDEQTGSWLARW